jgi:hypothetical protein
MATFRIYDETANSTKTVTVDFLGNILAQSAGSFVSEVSYYFQVRTNARDTDGINLPEFLVMSLDELVLNGVKQRRTDTADPYDDINDMIEDYLYDYVNGHAADQHSSGVAYRAPMAF